MNKYSTKDIVTDTVAKEIGWSLLRSAYMNCWGACSSLAAKEIDTADGGIDAFHNAQSQAKMREQDDAFMFATGLDTQVSPIVAARQWMGVVEVLYPMMAASDRLHPLEFVQERLNETPKFEMSDADLKMRMTMTGMSQETIVEKFREHAQIVWDKNHALRERTGETFKTIGSVDDAPLALIEKIEQFANNKARRAATNSLIERSNESLANVAMIKQDIVATEAIVTH
jgi:hypothetical protein